jgi:hypothetical protein
MVQIIHNFYLLLKFGILVIVIIPNLAYFNIIIIEFSTRNIIDTASYSDLFWISLGLPVLKDLISMIILLYKTYFS